MATLYWLSDDLRIRDNPALNLAAESDELAIVYCLDERGDEKDQFGSLRLGEHRRKAILSALEDLAASFEKYSQPLQLLRGVRSLTEALSTGQFDRVIRTRQHAADEVRDWLKLKREFPGLEFVEVDGATLFDQEHIQFGDEFPGSFSKFKRKLEKQSYRDLASNASRRADTVLCEGAAHARACEGGGETAALEKLANYFSMNAASTYKESRNQFMGDNFSTRFSPWLALGCVSPRQIIEALREYEAQQGANESTGWIEFELLWREFFRWYGAHYGRDLFLLRGICGQLVSKRFDQACFESWCHGSTGYPIVDACMKELKATGWLSNRGRQIVASCFVNELDLDWRAGAGYFESMLIDYDACSNWGNWQYIAGVGADPRGGRHFNLEKQAEIWDPDGSYQKRWLE